jgi:hypothetical protein
MGIGRWRGEMAALTELNLGEARLGAVVVAEVVSLFRLPFWLWLDLLFVEGGNIGLQSADVHSR